MQVLYCEVVFSSSCLVLVSGKIGDLLICLTQMNSLVQPRTGSVCCILLPVESGHNKTVYAQHCYGTMPRLTDVDWGQAFGILDPVAAALRVHESI